MTPICTELLDVGILGPPEAYIQAPNFLGTLKTTWWLLAVVCPLVGVVVPLTCSPFPFAILSN